MQGGDYRNSYKLLLQMMTLRTKQTMEVKKVLSARRVVVLAGLLLLVSGLALVVTSSDQSNSQRASSAASDHSLRISATVTAVAKHQSELASPPSLFTALSPDPQKFKWINATEVKAGEETCGWLTTPLGGGMRTNGGIEDESVYPKLRVYFCARFATIQPAPMGALFVHWFVLVTYDLHYFTFS